MAEPLPLPDTGVATVFFEIERVDYLSPEAGGRAGGVQAGFPRWRATWGITDRSTERMSDLWRAFRSRLRGTQRLIRATDPARPFPAAYQTGFAGFQRAAGGAFDGTATDWSVTGTRDTLTLAGLASNLKLGLGDYVGFEWQTSGQTRLALVRVVSEAAWSDASGEITVDVEPPLPTLVPGGAVATLARPACLMRQLVDQSSTGKMDRRRRVAVEVAAIQVLLA